MRILILNGPNLNLLGKREKNIYGSQSFENYLELLKPVFEGISIDFFQSNWEGGLIDKLHASPGVYEGIVLNAGGYTHTSVALADAVAAIQVPVVEVHISNLLKREEFRHQSLLGPNCIGTIMGFGLDSYRLGIESLRVFLNVPK
ncbi:MAG: type II 3-dehydroquinate dehydratase [Porphyromonadaceae bacterium]|nr:MAG: type II 3-dehydroquinate dehydratase [Porphyromonadaceae bacterium]